MNDWVRSLEFWMNDWNFGEPDRYYSMKRSQFRSISLHHWAAKEAIYEVKEHPGEDPIKVLEAFMDQIAEYRCRACTEDATIIFGTLYDVTELAVDYLRALLYV